MVVRRSQLIRAGGCAGLFALALLFGTDAALAQPRSAHEAVEHGAKVSRPIYGDTNPVGTMITGQPTPPAAVAGDSRSHRGMATRMNRSEVMDLQRALNREGAGLKVDGAMGPRTRDALMSFQSRNNLPVSGHLDGGTRSKLGL